MKKIFTILFLLLGCEQKENNLITVPSGLQPELRSGQSVKISDDRGDYRFILQATDIADSRCPEDTHCVWAGHASVRIRIVLKAGTHIAQTLCLGECAEDGEETVEFNTETGRWRVTLLSVDPYPSLHTPELTKTASFTLQKIR